MLKVAPPDSVDIGCRRLREEGRRVAGAYTESTTGSCHRHDEEGTLKPPP